MRNRSDFASERVHTDEVAEVAHAPLALFSKYSVETSQISTPNSCKLKILKCIFTYSAGGCSPTKEAPLGGFGRWFVSSQRSRCLGHVDRRTGRSRLEMKIFFLYKAASITEPQMRKKRNIRHNNAVSRNGAPRSIQFRWRTFRPAPSGEHVTPLMTP